MSDCIGLLFSGLNISSLGLNIPSYSMPSFGFNSVLDILLLTYVIYNVMMWIKQSRGWTLLKGVGVLLVFYFIASFLGLDVLVWIINKIAQAALVGIVVIFQPELRKALENLGKGRLASLLNFSSVDNSNLNTEAINEMVDAVAKLSKARTGALIVIEQEVGLSDLEVTGIKVDAVITSQLLINIFEDKTPLHDGAVVVRGNRISSATCIMPLTDDLLSSELGTRHRAAVGASEASDAVVLVVSEETGGISIAREGKLYRHLTPDDVRRMLEETLKPIKEPKQQKGRRKNEKD